MALLDHQPVATSKHKSECERHGTHTHLMSRSPRALGEEGFVPISFSFYCMKVYESDQMASQCKLNVRIVKNDLLDKRLLYFETWCLTLGAVDWTLTMRQLLSARVSNEKYDCKRRETGPTLIIPVNNST